MKRVVRGLTYVVASLALLTAFASYRGFGEPLFLFGLPFARPPAPLFAPGEVERAGTGDAVFTGKLSDPTLLELSGLVASRRTPGVFFAIQDSGGGDRARLYALDETGRSLGTWKIAETVNYDWEDLASFTHQGRAWIAIADIGDNQARRDELRVFVVPEPEVASGDETADEGASAVPGELHPAVTWGIRFSDGPRNCEAFAVDPEGDAILLLEKRGSPATAYQAPFAPMADTAVRVAAPIAEVRVPRPTARDLVERGPFGILRSGLTALDVAPDRRGAVVLTYGDAFFFPRLGSWAESFAAVPERIPLPPLQQGEAVAWDESGLLVTSEGAHAPVYRVPVGSWGASEPLGAGTAADASEPDPVPSE